jgi:hypothetical protein
MLARKLLFSVLLGIKYAWLGDVGGNDLSIHIIIERKKNSLYS